MMRKKLKNVWVSMAIVLEVLIFASYLNQQSIKTPIFEDRHAINHLCWGSIQMLRMTAKMHSCQWPSFLGSSNFIYKLKTHLDSPKIGSTYHKPLMVVLKVVSNIRKKIQNVWARVPMVVGVLF